MAKTDLKISEPLPTMDVCEAGRWLGVGKSAAYAAAKDGTLPVIRVGKSIRVLRAPLRRMLEGGEAA